MLDETHTLICGPGGLTREWGLEPDVVVVGKAIGGGLPLGAYGMSAELAAAFERGKSLDGEPGELATGGTLFGNALSMAAARAALTEVLTPEAYERAARARRAPGRRPRGRRRAAPACPGRCSASTRARASSPADVSPATAAEADADEQPELNALLRLYLANRGVWEAISTAGPDDVGGGDGRLTSTSLPRRVCGVRRRGPRNGLIPLRLSRSLPAGRSSDR